MISDGGPSRARSRLLAVVIAVALIGVSFAVRALVIDGDDDASGGGGRDGASLRVACIDELADVCAQLGGVVTVEGAGDTANRLIGARSAADAAVDAWITVAPWAQIVRDRRVTAGDETLLDADIGPVARSPLVLVARRDRADVLADVCGGEVTWTCVGDRAGTEWSDFGGDALWGRVRPAHADPETSADGLLALGQAVGDFVATPEIAADAVSRGDWENKEEFAGWFQRLERSIPADAFAPGRDPFARWLQTRGTAFDVVATTEANALPALAAAATDVREASTVLYPAAVATADIVLVPVAGGRDPSSIEDELRDALAAAGYRVDGEAPPAGAPALPDTDGLPSAGALDALRGLWAGVMR
jgi:hypothetical protein